MRGDGSTSVQMEPQVQARRTVDEDDEELDRVMGKPLWATAVVEVLAKRTPADSTRGSELDNKSEGGDQKDGDESDSGGSKSKSKILENKEKKKSKSKKSSSKREKIKRMKTIAWGGLGISELILAILILIQLLTFKSFVFTAANRSAEDQLKYLDLGYNIKPRQLSLGFQSLANSYTFRTFLSLSSSDSRFASMKEAVISSLQNEVTSRKLEYATLLNVNGDIIANANNDRSGESGWNSQLFELVKSNPEGGQVIKTTTLQLSELRLESPPVWREGAYSYESEQHMFDTNLPGLVRFVATPVFDYSDSFVGVLVAGDVVSGNTFIFEQTIDIFGQGLGSIVFRNQSSWIVATQYLVDNLNQRTFHFQIPSEILDKVSEGVVVDFIQGKRFSIAMKAIPEFVIGDEVFGQSPAILIRGHPHSRISEVLYEVIAVTLSLFAGTVLLDFLGTILALRFFIDPLERLLIYARFKAYKHYDPILNSIHLNQRFVIRVMIIGLLSASLMIGIVINNSLALSKVFEEQSATKAQIRAMDLIYEMKMNQMNFGFKSISLDTGLKSFLADLYNTSDPMTSPWFATTKSLLSSETSKRNIEIATLVDRDKKIIAHAFSDDRIGSQFDPFGLVSASLSTNQRISVTATMSRADFELENAIVSPDSSIDPTLEATDLMPASSDNTIIVRLSCTPVYASNNTVSKIPDGVLIAGDILNGKVGITETTISTFGEGFAGYYFWNEDTGRFEYITGAYRYSVSGSFDYNPSEMPISEILMEAKTSEVPVYKSRVKYQSAKYEVAVHRVKSNLFTDCTGFQRPYSGHSIPLFHVRAVSDSRWSDLKYSQLAVQISTVLFQLIALVGISYVLLLPIREFAAKLRKNFKVKGHAPTILDCCSSLPTFFSRKRQ